MRTSAALCHQLCALLRESGRKRRLLPTGNHQTQWMARKVQKVLCFSHGRIARCVSTMLSHSVCLQAPWIGIGRWKVHCSVKKKRYDATINLNVQFTALVTAFLRPLMQFLNRTPPQRQALPFAGDVVHAHVSLQRNTACILGLLPPLPCWVRGYKKTIRLQ
jgi:hypothetical protein